MAKTELVTRAEFAKRCGVSGAAITKALKNAPLRQCIEGKYVNAGHKEARKYCRSKNPDDDKRKNATHVRGTAAVKKKREAANPTGLHVPPAELVAAPPPNVYKPIEPDQEPEAEHDADDISKYLDMTLEEILLRFGDNVRFNEWLKAVKEIENIRDKRLRNDERESKYIPRDIAMQVFSRYERCFKLQLADATRSIAAQLHDNVEAGGTLESSTELAEDLIGAPIADAKKNVEVLLKEYSENGR